ncbi:hypothetical protein QNO07_05260 [Streptomyces sp. 549]|uniref:hypothetical protein n=1 Tax=Streptomyces sp. 549 TaxID=3049076 RepID=UPI0024C2A3AD|nr:hypothetical protein [Streptomyces sp. 549]MDK1472843.1 hypothetical protein [Streptomyces sp. 549]
MARNSAGMFVAGLTAAALAVVGVLAYQASAAQDKAPQARESKPPATSSPAPGASPEKAADPAALPADSGTGRRVVYALEAGRVWLVDESGKVNRTYEVTPGSVSPLPGEYTVSSRSAHITGSDGVPVENVVRFAQVGEAVVGFSAALDGKAPAPDPEKKTGGIREKRKDGAAMWVFATIGTKVVVIP